MSGQTRQIIAPDLFPKNSTHLPSQGKIYYLSWPGWELFLARQELAPAKDVQPLLLATGKAAEEDLAEIMDLMRQLELKGVNAWTSWLNADQEELHTITQNIKTPATALPQKGLLDDRLFLALFSIMRLQKQKAEALLAEAETKTKKMWASLKGQEINEEVPPTAQASTVSSILFDKVMASWQRLAAPLILPGDQIIAEN